MEAQLLEVAWYAMVSVLVGYNIIIVGLIVAMLLIITGK